MYISDIALDDYRSYGHIVTQLHPGINVLVGHNGQGKTNFVEAIHYMATFSSHRVSADQALVRFDAVKKASAGKARGAVVRLKVVRGGRERLIDIEIVAGKANRARLNRNQVPPKEIMGEVKSVLFAPEDLTIIRTDPGARRRFMDQLLSQAYPRYSAYLSDYSKVLAQRSATLKALKYSPAAGGARHNPMLDIWNDQMIDFGSHIISYRARLVRDLQPHADRVHKRISNEKHQLNLYYEPALSGCDDGDLTDVDHCAQQLAKAIDKVADNEVERTVNLVGPHRDDLGIYLDDMPVKGYASHGETWSVALSLRLGEFHLLRDIDDDAPILILDDVYAELDATRRQTLEDIMNQAEQVIVTAAVKDDIPADLTAYFYHVELQENEEGQKVSSIAQID